MAEEKVAPEEIPEDLYTVNVLDEGIWEICEERVRCFLIEGNDKALLIDSCMNPGTALSQVVAGITNKPVDLVFTHADRDHTNGQDGFDTPFLHPAEYERYQSNFATREIRPVWEGESFDLGGRQVDVVLIPGHTPGSIALLDKKTRRLFVGDTVSDLWIFIFGVGRNLKALIESLKKLKALSLMFDCIHPSHGSVELENEWIDKMLTGATKLLAGELVAEDPPMDVPCKCYEYEGIKYLYAEED